MKWESYSSRVIGGHRGEVDLNGKEVLFNIYDEYSSVMYTFPDEETFLEFLAEVRKSYKKNVVDFHKTYPLPKEAKS